VDVESAWRPIHVLAVWSLVVAVTGRPAGVWICYMACSGGLQPPGRAGWGRVGPWAWWPPGQVASTQALSRRARHRPIRLRRFNAAVRRLSQALFLAVRGRG